MLINISERLSKRLQVPRKVWWCRTTICAQYLSESWVQRKGALCEDVVQITGRSPSHRSSGTCQGNGKPRLSTPPPEPPRSYRLFTGVNMCVLLRTLAYWPRTPVYEWANVCVLAAYSCESVANPCELGRESLRIRCELLCICRELLRIRSRIRCELSRIRCESARELLANPPRILANPPRILAYPPRICEWAQLRQS